MDQSDNFYRFQNIQNKYLFMEGRNLVCIGGVVYSSVIRAERACRA
jgi:hypothetical protein